MFVNREICRPICSNQTQSEEGAWPSRPVTPESSCWAQSVDRRYPWICLRNLWIHTLRRNPLIAQISVDRATRSMNFAYDTILLAQTYMDGLVISTNLKLNNFTYFNGPLQSTEQNHRPSERLHGRRRSRQVPAVI